MKHYTYLIVGGGMAAAAATEGIRAVDGQGSIGILSREENRPYDRPPLSKQLWAGKKTVGDVWRALPEGADFHGGCTVAEVDLENREVRSEQGERFRFDKLLLATGGTPRRLPFGGNNIIYYRDLESYYRLRALSEEHDRFAVIGGGFIGSEIAAALAMNGKEVTMLFPEAALGSSIFPEELAHYVTEFYAAQGVKLLSGEVAVGLEGEGSDLVLQTGSGRQLEVNGVVAGIGIEPEVTLARAAGLEVDDGIVVDGALRTSHTDVYAAGDVARFEDRLLGGYRRVEHEDAANSMGRAAGRAMAGDDVLFDYSPMFYSDLFDLGYEAVGRLDATLETVADWQEPCRKGVIYYLDEGYVAGVLLWNVWDKVDAARQVIAKRDAVTVETLKGLI